MLIKGFVVRSTAGAVGFVADETNQTVATRPLWVPTSKTISFVERDVKGKNFLIQEGSNVTERVGIPCEMEICDTFATKVGLGV